MNPNRLFSALFFAFFCFTPFLRGADVTGYDVTMGQMVLEHRLGKVNSVETFKGEPLGIPYLSSSDNDKTQRNARLAATNRDFDKAEALYMKLLANADFPLPERLDVLLELSDMHVRNGAMVKTAAVLENFANVGVRDSRLPDVYLKLGEVYRGLGDFKKSQAAFNQVLNVSLGSNEANAQKAQQIALRAKMDITQNFLYMGEYNEAERHLKRIQNLPLDPKDREKVDWQASKLYYGKGQYALAEVNLSKFIKTFPNSPQRLEAEFLVSSSLRQLGRFPEALQHVQSLITSDQLKSEDPAQALYWKGQAGNQLANTFFEQGDYPRALTLYQSLVNLNPHYTWQWPVLYQIGLCYDRMNLLKKARESYQVIVEGSGDLPAHRPQPDETLRVDLAFIQEQSQWRIQQVDRRLKIEESI